MNNLGLIGSKDLNLILLDLINNPISDIFTCRQIKFKNYLISEQTPLNFFNLSKKFKFFLIFFLIFLIYFNLKPKPLIGIPNSGKFNWGIGDSLNLYFHLKNKKSRNSFFLNQSNNLGSISQIILGPAGTWLGKITGLGNHLIIINDPNQIIEISLKRSKDFPDPGLTLDIYKGIIPNGQLALKTDSVFNHHRRAIAHTMSNSYLENITPKITQSVTELIHLWKRRSEILDQTGEKYFKAAQDLRLSTMDTISDIIFGKPFGVMSNRIQHLDHSNGTLSADSRPKFPKLAHALNVIVAQVANCYLAPSKPLFWWFQRYFNPQFQNAKSLVFDYLSKQVEIERQLHFDNKNFQSFDHHHPDRLSSVLSSLVYNQEISISKGQKHLTNDEIIQELLVYWVAGHGTMACTLAWAVKLLSNHPIVQHRLRNQLINFLPTLDQRPPNFSDLTRFSSDLGYLDATCYEILRCSNILAEVSRTSRTDTIVMGHLIPKNTIIIMPNTFIGPQSNKLANHSISLELPSSQFAPERWIDSNGKFNPKLAGPLHVFGHGPRGCFGKKLALLELKLYIAMLSMELFFEKVPDHVNSMDSIEYVANHPQCCVVRPRSWSQIESNLS